MLLEKTDKPYISVVIPTFNRAELVQRSIESVLKQKYSNCEIIVVDDASSDNTADVLAGYVSSGKIKFLKLRSNKGQQKARNEGVNASAGDWILLLDSDDELTEFALAEIAGYIEKAADSVGVIAFPAKDTEENKVYGFVDGDEIMVSYHDLICEKKVKGEFIKCVRKVVFEKYRFNETVRGLNSLFWLKAARDWDCLYINKPLRLYYRGREDNIMHPKNILWRSEHLSRGLEILIKDHGEVLKRICPQKLAEKYLEMAYYLSVSGKKSKCVISLLKYFKFVRRIQYKDLVTVFGYLILGRNLIFLLKSIIRLS